MKTHSEKPSEPANAQDRKPDTESIQHAIRKSQPVARTPIPSPKAADRTPNAERRMPAFLPRTPQPVFSLDLGLIDYQKAWDLQQSLVAARVNNDIENDILLFLEHPAVFTLGRRGGLDNLLVSEAYLQESGIPVIQVERGGVITYHGPGQIVVYPIMNLHSIRIGVKEFVAAMEEAMLQTVGEFDIDAQRNPINSGIWVGHRKMGSIGIALRKGISFHGLALNVNLDLTPFSWIQPCGLQGVSMTSMRDLSGEDLPMDEVLDVLKNRLAAALGISYENCSLGDLERLMTD